MNALADIDRRWIFLLMAIAVALPIFLGITFEEKPTQLAINVFEAIEELPDGSDVLLAYDYDPATAGELDPMATAFTRQCAEKGHKMYFISLLPVGPQMIEEQINEVLKKDFPELVYGQDYVNLGFKSGGEGVIKVIVTDLRGLYSTDARGTAIDAIPMCKRIENVQDFPLICNVSGSTPGTKEWVQYAVTPYQDKIGIVAGCTGVQSPLMYPYIPQQLKGLLGAIKGAAEYEQLVVSKYSQKIENEEGEMVLSVAPKYQEGKRRMAPQLIAHILMILLIVVGNIIYFVQRAEGKVQ